MWNVGARYNHAERPTDRYGAVKEVMLSLHFNFIRDLTLLAAVHILRD